MIIEFCPGFFKTSVGYKVIEFFSPCIVKWVVVFISNGLLELFDSFKEFNKIRVLISLTKVAIDVSRNSKFSVVENIFFIEVSVIIKKFFFLLVFSVLYLNKLIQIVKYLFSFFWVVCYFFIGSI